MASKQSPPAPGPTLANPRELATDTPPDPQAALAALAVPPGAPQGAGSPHAGPVPLPGAGSGPGGAPGPMAPQPKPRRPHRATGNPRGRPRGSSTAVSGPVSDPPGGARLTGSKMELQLQLDAMRAELESLKARAYQQDVSRLERALDLSFSMLGEFAGKRYGPAARLDDAETETLAEAWAPALAPYLGEALQHSPLGAAAFVTLIVFADKRKAIIEAQKLANAQPVDVQVTS